MNILEQILFTFSLKSNSSTNWITSLNFDNFADYTDDFEVYDAIYSAIARTNNLFCIAKLSIFNGELYSHK